MEEKINDLEIPKTIAGIKYSWVRSDVDGEEYSDTFDTIEDCIEDAHDCWKHKAGGFDNVDYNGYDEINDRIIERPIILVGYECSIVDKLQLGTIIEILNKELSDEFSETVYTELGDNFYHHEKIRSLTNNKQLEDNLRNFIKDNFTMYPEKMIKIFELRYDLLADEWIK